MGETLSGNLQLAISLVGCADVSGVAAVNAVKNSFFRLNRFEDSMRTNLMFAIRQIIDDPQDVIPIPPELRHRRTEVIFIVMDEETKAHLTPSPIDAIEDAIESFRGKGKGGAVARLLMDRQSDREQEG